MAELEGEKQGYTRDMLTGDAREVADELKGNIAGFFREKGVENLAGLAHALKQRTLSAVDVAPVRQNIQQLQEILQTGEVPEALLEKRRIKDAERIFGEDFLGPETVKKTFGIHIAPEDVPQVPFNREEMEQAKEQGQMLILRIDQSDDGTPVSMEKINRMHENEQAARGKLLFNTDWYRDENFFKDTSRAGWALVSKDVIPGSTGKNYLEQTQAIADYLKDGIFQGGVIPDAYQEAIEEFQREKAGIASIITRNWREAAERLSDLKLNQLTRRTATEVAYDLAMRKENNNERLLQEKNDWTMSRSSGGRLVSVGHFVAGGANVHRWGPDYSYSGMGVVLSR